MLWNVGAHEVFEALTPGMEMIFMISQPCWAGNIENLPLDNSDTGPALTSIFFLIK